MSFPALIPSAYTLVGPILIASNANWLLLGTLYNQLYTYAKSRPRTKDNIWLATFVFSVTLVETVQTAIMSHFVWYLCVVLWGDTTALATRLPWSGGLVSPMTGIVAVLVQPFYAWRIWVLSRSIVLRAFACIIVMLSLMQFGASIPSAVQVIGQKGQLSALGPILSTIDIWLVGSLAADIIIAGCMVWLLYEARARTAWTQSQTLYDRLIINAVQTGLVTAVAASINLALWKVYPRDGYYAGAGILTGKLYSISFLSTLNGRAFRRDLASQTSSILPSYKKRIGVFNSLWRQPHKATTHKVSGNVEVHVLQGLERHTDEHPTDRTSLETGSGIRGHGVTSEDWKAASDTGEHVLQLSPLAPARMTDENDKPAVI